MYEHVLLPTDGSDGTRQAVEHAVAIADRFDATLHALSVLVEDPYGSLERESVRQRAERDAERAIERVEREADRAGVETVAAVRSGVPDEEILAYAEAEGVDAIVMGTHGRTGLDRVLVGSVTERVVRNASVPVVTVRTTERIRLEDPDEATDLAVDAAESAGYADPTPTDEPHRTSGSWIVPLDVTDGKVHVHVDAATRDARVATIE